MPIEKIIVVNGKRLSAELQSKLKFPKIVELRFTKNSPVSSVEIKPHDKLFSQLLCEKIKEENLNFETVRN